MQNMGSCIDTIPASGFRSKVKIMVGGAPVTEGFAREVGADGYAPDAGRAVKIVESLTGG
jgi:5-methyltetrahydrofolate--homocysteine methyltransferase